MTVLSNHIYEQIYGKNQLWPTQIEPPYQLTPEFLPTIWISGARLHTITENECVTMILNELDDNHGGAIVTMNLDHLRRYNIDPTYKALCDAATLIVPDGMPLVWASRLQGTPLPERVTGSNLIWSLSEMAAANKKSIYLLGGAPGTMEATASVLQQRYPGVQIAGMYCPKYGFENNDQEIEHLIKHLKSTSPDIIFVALGSPKQEMLINRLRNHLPESWWIGVGISFSFVGGDIARAPVWMQQAGLEWAHRLWQEPGRLAKRYLVHGIPFAGKLMGQAAINRVTQKFEHGYQS
ncbi:MAG: WecB/TagA/CpsF family glycosyltransferase [Anaerolineae bacterium]|nr:WecB/TagA/CpsF family glycosyltransferase [Anaerolineae bacterium]